MCPEVMNLLANGAVETVLPAQSELGYSRYFRIPKKDGGLRPILDLRHLNCALMRRPFRMITLKQILLQVCPVDWFLLLDLKDAYFHIQIAPPHHRQFLRFAFEGVAYQYTVSGCLWLPALLPSAWTQLFPLWGRWESAFSTTLTSGLSWPSRRQN